MKRYMENNFERFILGNIVINVNKKSSLNKLYYKMYNIGLCSIQEHDLKELEKKIDTDLVCQYIPGEGFIFDKAESLDNILGDMYQSTFEIIDIDDLFPSSQQHQQAI